MGEEEEPPRETFATAAIALSTGKGRLKARQLDDAADALGQALEMSIAEHGEESSAVAEYYFAYGDVLLSIVENNGDVFGTGAQTDPGANQENAGASEPRIPCAHTAHRPARSGRAGKRRGRGAKAHV